MTVITEARWSDEGARRYRIQIHIRNVQPFIDAPAGSSGLLEYEITNQSIIRAGTTNVNLLYRS